MAVSVIDGSETTCGGGGGGAPPSSSGAPSSAAYVVLSLHSDLSAERVLTAGTGISITDGGANGTVTIAATGGGAPTGAQYLTLATHADLSAERVLTVTAGHLSLTDGGANGNATLGLSATGTAGTYAYPSAVTTDAQGRVTAIVAGSTPALASVTVTAGMGLTGGGALSGPITLNVAAGDGTIVVNTNDITVGTLQTGNYSDGSVTSIKLRNSAALSVIGRSVNSVGVPGDIAVLAGSNGVLLESGGSLAFNEIFNVNINASAAIAHSKLANLTGASVLGRAATSSGAMAAITGSTIGHVLTVQADNTIAFSAPSGGTVDGSGAATRLAFWSDADTLTSDAGLTFGSNTLNLTLAAAAGHVIGQIKNSDTGASSHALHTVESGGTGAGDAYYRAGDGTNWWTWGHDNSTTNNNWSLGKSTTLGTSTVLAFDTVSGGPSVPSMDVFPAASTQRFSIGWLATGSGAYPSNTLFMSTSSGHNMTFVPSSDGTTGAKMVLVGRVTGNWHSALEYSNVAAAVLSIEIGKNSGNVAVAGAGSFGGGAGVLFIANASTAPVSNPTGGVISYVDAADGRTKLRDTTGTITILN